MSDEDFEQITYARRQNYAVEIIGTAQEIYQVEITESTYRALLKILLKAMKIWKMTRMQRAKYEFILLGLDKFSSHYMANQYGQDESELEGRPITIPIFPMVIKYGDEHGEHVSNKLIFRWTFFDMSRWISGISSARPDCSAMKIDRVQTAVV